MHLIKNLENSHVNKIIYGFDTTKFSCNVFIENLINCNVKGVLFSGNIHGVIFTHGHIDKQS
jgi:hypothetical protein